MEAQLNSCHQLRLTFGVLTAFVVTRSKYHQSVPFTATKVSWWRFGNSPIGEGTKLGCSALWAHYSILKLTWCWVSLALTDLAYSWREPVTRERNCLKCLFCFHEPNKFVLQAGLKYSAKWNNHNIIIGFTECKDRFSENVRTWLYQSPSSYTVITEILT